MHIQIPALLLLELPCLLLIVHILTTLSIPGAWMARRSTAVVPTGSIGPLLGAVVATPTSWASAVVTSTQAQAATSSTTGGWRVALAVYSYSVCSFSSGSQELFKDFASAKYLEVGAKNLKK